MFPLVLELVILLLLVSFAIVGVLIVYHNRIRKKVFQIDRSKIKIDLMKLEIDEMHKTSDENSKRFRFFKGLAHDLNNALFNIGGRLSLLLDHRRLAPETIDRHLESASITTRSCHSLSKELEIEGHGSSTLFDVELLLEDLIEEFKVDPRIKWKLHETIGPSIQVHLPRITLYRTVSNIFKNCVEALSQTDKPVISVSTYMVGDMAMVEIIDNGPGMSKEQLEKLSFGFTTKGLGHGLGMNIVRELLGYYGAVLEVDSAIGTGTTFKILIPVTDKDL